MEEKIFEKIIQARPQALVYWNSKQNNLKMEEKIFNKIIQARPPALVYWNSEPKLKFKEQRLIVTTGLTFLTVSKVRQEQLVDSLDQIMMLTI